MVRPGIPGPTADDGAPLMVCTPLPGGGFACGPRRRPKSCGCGSGRAANLLCDWKTGPGKTCDAPLCPRCTFSPAPDKDLCPDHRIDFLAWKGARIG